LQILPGLEDESSVLPQNIYTMCFYSEDRMIKC
jgi:hypothetical protein